MTCAIHQPQYLPWLGYFDKMRRADVFVLLDDVQFKKNEWQNRNRIRIPNEPGWQWLTVPVLHEFGQKINAVRLNPAVNWRAQHIRAIETNYARAPGFSAVWSRLRPLYAREWSTLGELNIACVQLLANILGLTTRIVVASTLNIASTRTQRLVDICRAVDCDTYLSGAGAEAYMDFDEFRSSGLTLAIQQYHHPVYSQLWTKSTDRFISHLSVIDWIFNDSCTVNQQKGLGDAGAV